MNWQPIETAPKDGTVILTDAGTARYVDQKYSGSSTWVGWFLCDAGGNIPSCADSGWDISMIYPKFWMPLLSLPN